MGAAFLFVHKNVAKCFYSCDAPFKKPRYYIGMEGAPKGQPFSRTSFLSLFFCPIGKKDRCYTTAVFLLP